MPGESLPGEWRGGELPGAPLALLGACWTCRSHAKASCTCTPTSAAGGNSNRAYTSGVQSGVLGV